MKFQTVPGKEERGEKKAAPAVEYQFCDVGSEHPGEVVEGEGEKERRERRGAKSAKADGEGGFFALT